MNILVLIKEYQGLIGTLVGSFLAIVSSISLWIFKGKIEARRELKNNNKEIEKIFIAAIRECIDSENNLIAYVEEVERKMNKDNKDLNVFLPPKLNRVYVNEDRLIALSRKLDHVSSQQIDIASSAVKKFNGWLEQFEKTPEFIFDASIKILQTDLKSKGEVVKDYYKSIKRYNESVKEFNERVEITKLHILRPVAAMQHKKRNLEKLFISNKLESALDSFSKCFLLVNKEKF